MNDELSDSGSPEDKLSLDFTIKRLSEATVLLSEFPQAEAWGFGMTGKSPTCLSVALGDRSRPILTWLFSDN